MTQAAILAASGSPGTTTGFKNKLINGNMAIDQRNAGAAFGTSINGYGLDRWTMNVSATGKINGGQNYNSVTPPVGFANYLGVQSQSAYSVPSGDYFVIGQFLEGFNTADLGWGTANAKTVTISAWVYSSLTGTFGGAISNSANDNSYPFTYTISSANTWTQISITVAGPTSGTWIGATNGVGLRLWFGLGVGSTYSGTAGAWASGVLYLSATGATSVVSTNAATFYITGCQLEVGTTATNFDFRSYGTELALCQRYFWASYGTSASGYTGMGAGGFISSTSFSAFIPYPVQMRATPTFAQANLQITTTGYPSVSSIGQNYSSQYGGRIDFNTSSSSAGYGGVLGANGVTSAAYLTASAEL